MPWVVFCAALLLVAYSWDGRRWVPARCELNVAPHLLPPPWQAEMLAAMSDWNAVSGRFQFVANNVSLNTVSCNDYGSFNGRIAFTNLYPTPHGSVLTNVYIIINTYYNFTIPHPGPLFGRDPSNAQMCLGSVLRHELGHALHLGHSTDPTSIMLETLERNAPPTPLGPDDVSGIRAIYP